MRLTPWQRGDVLSADRLNEGRREMSEVLIDWQSMVDRLAALEATVSQMAALRWFVGILGASTADGDNRWYYDFTQAVQTASGYDGWTKLHPDEATAGTCRNLLEDANSDIQVNGTTIANLAGTMEFQPIPPDTPVVILPQLIDVGTGDNRVTYWFIPIPNNLDGSC